MEDEFTSGPAGLNYVETIYDPARYQCAYDTKAFEKMHQ